MFAYNIDKFWINSFQTMIDTVSRLLYINIMTFMSGVSKRMSQCKAKIAKSNAPSDSHALSNDSDHLHLAHENIMSFLLLIQW